MKNYIVVISILLTGNQFSNLYGQTSGNQTFCLTVNDNSIIGDSVVLYIYENTLFSKSYLNWADPKIIVARRNKDRKFVFNTLKINKSFYFSLGWDFQIIPSGKYLLPLINMYLGEIGDNILIDICKDTVWHARMKKNDNYYTYIYQYESFSVKFSGRGSAKYSCRYEADRVTATLSNEGSVVDRAGKLQSDLFLDKCFDTSILILNKAKQKMSSVAYQVLYADFIGKFKGDWYGLFPWDWIRNSNDLSFKLEGKRALAKRINGDHFIAISETAKTQSAFYSAYIIQRETAKGWADSNRNESVVFNYLHHNYKGELQDKLITAYLVDWYPYLTNNEALLTGALDKIQTTYFFNKLEELRNQQSKGKLAYPFSLPDMNDNIIKLEDFKGKIVLIDFWYTGCTGCAQFYKTALKDVEEAYKNNSNISFVSISVDLNKEKWIKSVYSKIYTSPSVINLYTNENGGEDEVIKYYKINGYPKPLLIDKQGKIFSASATDLRKKEKLRELIEEALKSN